MSLKRLVPMQPVASMPASVEFYEKLVSRLRAGTTTGAGPCLIVANAGSWSINPSIFI